MGAELQEAADSVKDLLSDLSGAREKSSTLCGGIFSWGG